MSATVTITSVALLLCIIATIILLLKLRQERKARQSAEAELLRTSGLLNVSRQSEGALRSTEERFQKLLESRLVAAFSADETFVTEANDTFLCLTGCARDELAARRVRWRDVVAGVDRLPLTHPCELELVHKKGNRVHVLFGAFTIQDAP